MRTFNFAPLGFYRMFSMLDDLHGDCSSPGQNEDRPVSRAASVPALGYPARGPTTSAGGRRWRSCLLLSCFPAEYRVGANRRLGSRHENMCFFASSAPVPITLPGAIFEDRRHASANRRGANMKTGCFVCSTRPREFLGSGRCGSRRRYSASAGATLCRPSVWNTSLSSIIATGKKRSTVCRALSPGRCPASASTSGQEMICSSPEELSTVSPMRRRRSRKCFASLRPGFSGPNSSVK
jgi:hypothetical protein